MKRFFLFTVCTLVGLVCASCDEKLSSITGPDAQPRAHLLEHSGANLQRERFERPPGLHRMSYRSGPHPARGTRAPRRRSYQQLVGRASTGEPAPRW